MLCTPAAFLYATIAVGMVIASYPGTAPWQFPGNDGLEARDGRDARLPSVPGQVRDRSVTASRCPVCGNMSSTRARRRRSDGMRARSFASVTGLQLE